MDRPGRLQAVESEIRQAKAEALGRAGERLEGALARLVELDRELDRLLGRERGDERATPAVAQGLTARNQLRDEARRLVHELIIQREAVGLRSHGIVLERYPIPPRRDRE